MDFPATVRRLRSEAVVHAAGRTVLVVDDVVDHREICRDFLRFYGFTVVEASDGREAVRCAQEVRPDLIVMDLSMPNLSGWEATKQLKADPHTAVIPVFVTTAFSTLDPREVIEEIGCDGFFVKPYHPDSLLTAILTRLT